MQTFLPYPNFEQSAKCLDNKRLGKQRIEGLQILDALYRGPFSCTNCRQPSITCHCSHRNIRATPWYNHPATQLWKGYELQLCFYVQNVIDEWKSRGFKDKCEEKLEFFLSHYEFSSSTLPWFIGLTEFHNSHKAALLAKYPEHYSQFNWDVEPEVKYLWKRP